CIKVKEPELNITGGCFPEGHDEAKTVVADIRNLKTKVYAGASELISQMFFENTVFYRFRERCEIAGIK
ncbi:methylenetetrahydrofolate reductase, partial [Megasphaera massiliensis]